MGPYAYVCIHAQEVDVLSSVWSIAMTQISGLRAWSVAVPKLRLWTYRSIHSLSQHAYVVRWPKQLEVNWAKDPRMVLPHRRFEAFPSMLAVNEAVQL